jgi:hypothetical protein
MKIRFIKNLDVDMDKTNLKEVWPRYIHRNDIYDVDRIESIDHRIVNLVLDNKDVLLEVPIDSFQCIKSR